MTFKVYNMTFMSCQNHHSTGTITSRHNAEYLNGRKNATKSMNYEELQINVIFDVEIKQNSDVGRGAT